DSGKVEISSDNLAQGQDKSDDPYFTEPLRTREVFIQDIYYSKTLGKLSMTFSAPLYCLGHQGEHIFGVLVARVDLDQSLYALLLERTGMGQTGETLIVNSEAVALSELRWQENAPTKLRISADPAVLASQGNEGIVETVDYRDVKVLAAYSYVPRTKWGFVAKQDQAEVYALIRVMLRNTLFLLIISAGIVLAVAFMLARGLAQPVVAMTEVSKRIQRGDLSARNDISSRDELGFLAETFNTMAESVAEQMAVQEGVAQVLDTMVSAGQLERAQTALFECLLRLTQSDLGAFHRLNSEGTQYELVTAQGISAALQQPIKVQDCEGQFSKVLTTRQIAMLTDIPEDTPFQLKTFAGTVNPKAIVTIPLTVKNQVLAIMSLASLKPYSTQSQDIIRQSWMSLNTAFSNLLASEQTATLAQSLNDTNEELTAQAFELKAQNEEIRAQRRQVEESNRLKSEFLSNMSHELRTPLNSVMVLSRVLAVEGKDQLSEEQMRYLEIIERNGKNLLTTINDILDLSKIEAGRVELTPESIPVKQSLDTLLETLAPLAQEKGLDLELDIPGDLEITTDAPRFQQILQNLIGNAIKFTPEGQVSITASVQENMVIIHVSDTGIGIPADDLPYIFNEFRQVDGSSSRQFEGTGLGLAIARKSADILGGTLSASSTLGQGSIFTLKLPLVFKAADLPAQPILPARLTRALPQAKTILVVDDEIEMVEMICLALEDAGYRTVPATSGTQALRLARECRPFAIMLDVMMPEMDGWEVLQNLKREAATADIPVIICSACEDLETGVALGAVGYVTKPVDKITLLKEIRQLGGAHPHRILIADDNEIDRQQMIDMIETEGMQALTAANGQQCLALLEQSWPDVLVLDLMMPDLDGFGVLDQIHTQMMRRHLPVIVVTAKDLTQEDRARLSGKVSSVLTKTEDGPQTMLIELKKILARMQSPASPHILLVEDNEAAIIQVRNVLEREGFIVDVASGGQQALDYVQHTVPHGIILDLMMPDVDGFAVLESVRSSEVTATIPVLILTAKELTREDRQKLSANNIQELVQKGDIDREGLLSKVRQMLKLDRGPAQPELDAQNVKVQASTPSACASPERAPGQRKLLIIEDNSDNLMSLKAVVGHEHTVLEAANGEQGLAMAIELQPDLIFLDMSLPGMDGFSVVRRLKEEENTKQIVVIALTAQAMKGDREKTLNAGCDDYLAKPFVAQELLAR
ncbi:MAG: response regulator, partial [Phycisphaeraceae bacterium]|nr:response regulator [Phycisphaeraceae bacterium]